jgi:hypothetical protein
MPLPMKGDENIILSKYRGQFDYAKTTFQHDMPSG